MTGFSISMDLAPKKSRSEASSAHASTAEQRLKVFMQDVTGRALVMMESATQGQQGIAMDLVQEAFQKNKLILQWLHLMTLDHLAAV